MDLTKKERRNEAREAIGILALRKDSLDLISISVGSVAVPLFIGAFTILFFILTHKNTPNLSGLAFDFFSNNSYISHQHPFFVLS